MFCSSVAKRSLYCLCCSFFWGKMSDRFGRRPVLLIGTLGSTISSALLGFLHLHHHLIHIVWRIPITLTICSLCRFSMNFPLAIISRSLCGILNGNLGVTKTYMGEVIKIYIFVSQFISSSIYHGDRQLILMSCCYSWPIQQTRHMHGVFSLWLLALEACVRHPFLVCWMDTAISLFFHT